MSPSARASKGLRGDALGERVRACLERVNLPGFEHRRPHQLSQGEKRRVCLAGVLACASRGCSCSTSRRATSTRADGASSRNCCGASRRPRSSPRTTWNSSWNFAPARCCSTAAKLVADGPTVDLLSDEALMLAHGLEKAAYLATSTPTCRLTAEEFQVSVQPQAVKQDQRSKSGQNAGQRSADGHGRSESESWTLPRLGIFLEAWGLKLETHLRPFR